MCDDGDVVNSVATSDNSSRDYMSSAEENTAPPSEFVNNLRSTVTVHSSNHGDNNNTTNNGMNGSTRADSVVSSSAGELPASTLNQHQRGHKRTDSRTITRITINNNNHGEPSLSTTTATANPTTNATTYDNNTFFSGILISPHRHDDDSTTATAVQILPTTTTTTTHGFFHTEHLNGQIITSL